MWKAIAIGLSAWAAFTAMILMFFEAADRAHLNQKEEDQARALLPMRFVERAEPGMEWHD